MTTALWIAAIAMIVVGVAGTVLPALPGLVLVFGGIVLAAWIDGFTRISAWTIGGLAVLTLIGFAADYVAAALGARKAGASKLAVVGAAIGTLAGIFTGFIGLLFMPLVGAAVGDVAGTARRHGAQGRDRVHDAGRVRHCADGRLASSVRIIGPARV
jgi:uncharacterized protein YqgC (DUF456 family)